VYNISYVHTCTSTDDHRQRDRETDTETERERERAVNSDTSSQSYNTTNYIYITRSPAAVTELAIGTVRTTNTELCRQQSSYDCSQLASV